jgi:signal transduction histidine kinase
MLSAKELPKEIARDVERICSESKRTSDLLRTLLSFGRKKIEAKEPLCIQKVVEEAATLKKYSLKNNNITLQYNPLPEPPLIVWGDRVQLMQVLINLINNSEQAILESKDKGSIGLEICKKDNHVDLVVNDSGPGIDAKDRDRIFEAFFTTKGENHGTGLGLYISHNIVQEHGGQLSLVEGASGNTQFQVRLPLKGDETRGSLMENAGTL